MATTAQRFYPTTTDQDQAWGTDIRKLDDGNGSLVSTTINQHPNAEGTTTITADPYTSRSTQGDNRDVYGWSFDENSADGMQSTATEKRVIPSGTWTFQNRIAIPAGGTATGSHNVTLSWRVYRVAADTTRATLFTVTSSEIGGGLLGSTQTFTTTSSQSEILLQADETLHVGLTTQDRQVAGALGATTAGNLTIHTGTENSVDIFVEVPTPGVRTKYLKTQDARLSGVDTIVRAVKLLVPTARLDGNAAHTKAMTLFRTIAAALVGSDTLNRTVSAYRVFSTVFTGAPSQVKKVLKAFSAVFIGAPTLVKKVIKTLAAVLVGADAQIKKKIFGLSTFSVTMRGASVFNRALTIRRYLFTVLLGRARGKTTFDFANVPGDTAPPAVHYRSIFAATSISASLDLRLPFVRRTADVIATCSASMCFIATVSSGGGAFPAQFVYATISANPSVERRLQLHRSASSQAVGVASLSFRKITDLPPSLQTYVEFGKPELKWQEFDLESKWGVTLWDTVGE